MSAVLVEILLHLVRNMQILVCMGGPAPLLIWSSDIRERGDRHISWGP